MPELKELKQSVFTKQTFLKDLKKVSQRIERSKPAPKLSKT